jgi:hypothetical protein
MLQRSRSVVTHFEPTFDIDLSLRLFTYSHHMDGRNNQFNPQDTQNRQLINVPPELGRIVQSGVTPEQFAENARQLEAYSRMNAMALQVYLQRQSQEAEQRRQYE